MNEIRNRPAALPLIGIIFGILAGERFYAYKYASSILLISTAILVISLYFKNKKKSLLLFSFSALSGYLLITPFVSFILPENHIVHHIDIGKKPNIIGIVSSEPSYIKNKCKFELSVTMLKNNKKNIPVTGKIIVTWITEGEKSLSRGDLIEFSAGIKRIKNFYNPKGFDYERYMAFKKIYASSFIYKNRLKIIKKNDPAKSKYSIRTFRENFSLSIDKLPSERERGILKALLTGERNQISEETRSAFNNSGISHILAISGLHIGIAAYVSFFIFVKFLSLSAFLLERGLVKKISALLTIIIALIYGIFAGMSPPTQRAVIMIAIYLSSFLFEKEPDTLNSLAAAGIVILIIDPCILFSVSFILSFTAVFAICYGLKKIDVKNKNGIYTFFLVSVFASLGTLPIILHYFNTLCIIGPLVNFIAVPIICFIVVPMGLASVFIYPFSPVLSFILLKTSSSILSPSVDLIEIIAKIPFVYFKTVTPNIIEILSFYILIIAFVNYKESDRAKTVALFTALILCCDTAYWIKERFSKEDLKITVLDVGQGNAALIEFPKGKCMLIDGGGFSDNSSFDVGKSIVAPFLWKKKIRTVETIVLTHPDSDHINGLTYIAKNFSVKEFWSNNESENTKGYKAFIRAVKEKKIKNIDFQKLAEKHIIERVKIEILNPPKNFYEMKKYQPWRNQNNNSFVIRIEYGDFSFLFTGDIMKKAETDLVKNAGKKLQSKIMLAPHHGSKTSSSDILLNAVSPEFVIISAGSGNRYGCPHDYVIDKYKNRKYKILRTDIDGAITIKSYGKTFDYNTCAKTY